MVLLGSTNDDNEPKSSELVIAKGFSSSERILENIAEQEEQNIRDAEKRSSEELVKAKKELPKFTDTRASSGVRDTVRTTPLDMNSISTLTASTKESSGPLLEAQPKVTTLPTTKRKKSNLAIGVRSAFRAAGGVSDLSVASAKLAKRKSKASLRGARQAATSEATRKSLRSAGRTTKRAARVTGGAALIAGSRVESRIFDKPQNQRPIFRPFEEQERRRLGLASGDVFSSEELRLLSVGVTPPAILRQRRFELEEIDAAIQQLNAGIIDAEDVNAENQRLIAERFGIIQANPGASIENNTRLAEIASRQTVVGTRVREIQNTKTVLNQLAQRRQSILSSQVNVSDAVKQRAFRAALQRSPSFNPNPVGVLNAPSPRRGRPPKVRNNSRAVQPALVLDE